MGPREPPPSESARAPARVTLSGGEMRYILAIFIGILLIIFGIVGGLIDLVF